MSTGQIHPSAVLDEGCVIGEGTSIWHFSHVMPGATIGSHCHLGQNVVVCSGSSVGNFVRIQNNVSIYSGVVLEDYVFVGPSAVFTNVINPRSAISRKHEFRSTIIRTGATIGANATIVCGNEIGRFAFVGAGAVVTASVPDYALVIGCPAKQVGWVSEYGHKLTFDQHGRSTCFESHQSYQLKDGAVLRVS